MRQLLTRALTVMVLTAMAVRPSAAANKEHQQLMADLRILQEQQQILQNLIGSLGEALKEAIKAVNSRLDEQVVSNRKSFADEKLVVDNLSSDLRIVREKVDDTNVRIGSVSQEVEALRQALQQPAAPRFTSTETADANPGAPQADAANNAAAASPAAAPIAVGTSPTRLYDQAYGNFGAGLFDLAIDGWEAYVRTFPKSDMADDAQVFIGNSYVQQGKNDKAIEAYDKAIRTYPSGNAIPEAYYKKGLALANLKETEPARDAWEYVIKNYPDSTAALLARQQLAKLLPKGK